MNSARKSLPVSIRCRREAIWLLSFTRCSPIPPLPSTLLPHSFPREVLRCTRCSAKLAVRIGVRVLSSSREAKSQPRLSLRASKLTQRAYTFIDLRSTQFVSAHFRADLARVHTLKHKLRSPCVGSARGARAAGYTPAARIGTNRPATYRSHAGLHKRTSHTALAPSRSTAVCR